MHTDHSNSRYGNSQPCSELRTHCNYTQNTTFSTSALENGVGLQHQAPTALPPAKPPGTHCTGGWVGPRASPDVSEKNLAPTGIFFFWFFLPYLFVSCSLCSIVQLYNCVQLSVRVLSYCVLWIFPLRKFRRLRSGANPRSWVPEASTQTP
jgi:hypothetical protein